MLAGDTAQSIAVGVGFRFTDVRQIFWEKFRHRVPDLIPLFHNYRSHAGVLRLAASVLELLYKYFPHSLDAMPPDQGLFDGPKPVIMDVSDLSELVLILEGSKRETARIEFGAHQVVIVRNEDTKETLCKQFNVDKEWIMTVQQSKGLEFDDVLLYNFFTDSDANEMWRIVAGFSKEDLENLHDRMGNLCEYEGDTTWDEELDVGQTRPLPFDEEKHKILENELKMLYTAITRARVNVFFAESDVKGCCRPVFNYFMRRQVVDDVKKAKQDKNANLRVFGNTSSSEDWRRQGEIYLQKANGDQARRMLNLAMKCFVSFLWSWQM
jgi:superfamily I DNA/RNA helicase